MLRHLVAEHGVILVLGIVPGVVAQLGGPPRRVSRAAEQFINLIGALERRSALEERLNLLRQWERTGQVETHAPEELLVGALSRRHDPEFPQLGDYLFVHFRPGGDLRVSVPEGVGYRPVHRHGLHTVVVEHDDVRVAGAGGGDESVLIDCRDRLVVAPETGQLRDILRRAVPPMDDHLQLPGLVAPRELDRAGTHLEAIKCRGCFGVVLGSVFDPLQNQLVFPASLLEAQFALVLFLHRRLEQQEAVRGV